MAAAGRFPSSFAPSPHERGGPPRRPRARRRRCPTDRRGLPGGDRPAHVRTGHLLILGVAGEIENAHGQPLLVESLDDGRHVESVAAGDRVFRLPAQSGLVAGGRPHVVRLPGNHDDVRLQVGGEFQRACRDAPRHPWARCEYRYTRPPAEPKATHAAAAAITSHRKRNFILILQVWFRASGDCRWPRRLRPAPGNPTSQELRRQSDFPPPPGTLARARPVGRTCAGAVVPSRIARPRRSAKGGGRGCGLARRRPGGPAFPIGGACLPTTIVLQRGVQAEVAELADALGSGPSSR